MKKFAGLLGAVSVMAFVPTTAMAKDRIVVLGSGTAEVVALLGKDKDLVGVGRTSTYPASLQENNPIVAYVHRAPAEGILSVKPTHVIGTDRMGPEQTIEVLEKEPSIKLFRTKENANMSDVPANIRLIGGFLGEYDKADKIAKQVEDDFKAVTEAAKDLPEVDYALVYYYKGKLFASGSGSTSLTMSWAKGKNVFAGVPRRTEAQKEALLAKDPKVILMYSKSFDRLKEDGKSLEDLPGLKETSAYKNGKLFKLPGIVYAMGPRTPQAVNLMIGKLHGDSKMAKLPKRAYAPADSLGVDK